MSGMSKGTDKGGFGWSYKCTCGYSTPLVGDAVKHVNEAKEGTHKLVRSDVAR